MMSHKTIGIIGWIPTIMLALLFAMSACMKLALTPTAQEQAVALNIPPDTFRIIGLVEIISLTLFLIPRTGVIGTLLLIAYMGGAISVHVQQQQSIGVVVTIQILIWGTAAIRFPELRQRLLSGLKK